LCSVTAVISADRWRIRLPFMRIGHPRFAASPPFREIARRVSWTDRSLAAASQAGLVNNLNDALVYPSLLAAVSDATHPAWRASALGVYRFWRDAGYAIGALIGGITAAVASLDAEIGVAAVLAAVSGILAWTLMRETRPRPVTDGGSARATAGEAARRINGGTT
jgi:hypothetical protein